MENNIVGQIKTAKGWNKVLHEDLLEKRALEYLQKLTNDGGKRDHIALYALSKELETSREEKIQKFKIKYELMARQYKEIIEKQRNLMTEYRGLEEEREKAKEEAIKKRKKLKEEQIEALQAKLAELKEGNQKGREELAKKGIHLEKMEKMEEYVNNAKKETADAERKWIDSKANLDEIKRHSMEVSRRLEALRETKRFLTMDVMDGGDGDLDPSEDLIEKSQLQNGVDALREKLSGIHLESTDEHGAVFSFKQKPYKIALSFGQGRSTVREYKVIDADGHSISLSEELVLSQNLPTLLYELQELVNTLE